MEALYSNISTNEIKSAEVSSQSPVWSIKVSIGYLGYSPTPAVTLSSEYFSYWVKLRKKLILFRGENFSLEDMLFNMSAISINSESLVVTKLR